MVRRLPLIVTLLVGPILTTQSPPAPSYAEYPDFDRPLWGLLKNGFDAASAARSLERAPDSVATFTQLADAQRPDDALRVIERAVAARPEDLLPAVTALRDRVSSLDDEASGRRERLRSIVSAIRAKLPSLPREEVASIEYALLAVDWRLERASSQKRQDRLRRIVDLYPSTAAARLAEVDLLASILPMSSRVEALESFARSHRGTVEGAKALYLAAFDIAHNLPQGVARKGEEPSARFAKVVSMVRELESGAWPASEWVTRAPSLVTGFSAYQPRHSPEGIRRMVDLYREFVGSHFVIEDSASGWSAAYVITTRLPELLRAGGDASLVGMEPMFEEWARVTGESDAVSFARALAFQRGTSEAKSPDRAMWLQRARQAFAELAASGTGLYQRKALATLASLHFRERDFASAARVYQQYLDAHSRYDFAWAATLRLGQSHEQLGDWSAASVAYRSAATKFPENNPARVLGLANAARAAQALGNYADALRLYRSARQAWNADYVSGYGLGYQLNSPVRPEGGALKSGVPITPGSLSAALDRLEIATTIEGGELIERGRWLIAYERWDEARVVLDRFLTGHPRSPLAAEVRYRSRIARLQEALALADVEGASPNSAAVLAALDAIAEGPWDPAVGIARIARASMMLLGGDEAAAARAMRAALTEWHARQAPPPGAAPLQGIEEDVAEIRKVAFRPAGGDPYTRERRWEAFPKTTLQDFVTVKPEMEVRLPGRTVTIVRAFRGAADLPPVLFVDEEQIALLSQVVAKLGGTRTREPEQIMEVPNQPVGGSIGIVNFWNRYFNAVPGHWGGWMFESPPTVTRIEFLNTERTKASVFVTIRYEGATLVMEKIDGVWKVIALTNRWIT